MQVQKKLKASKVLCSRFDYYFILNTVCNVLLGSVIYNNASYFQRWLYELVVYMLNFDLQTKVVNVVKKYAISL